MNKEEYYKRLEKTTEKIKTDRCSEDEIANINRQKLYLAEHYISSLEQENEKLHHYKTLYQSLNKQKEELRSWLEEKIQYIDTIYLGIDKKNYSDDTILDMSSRKWGYKDTLNKLEELEGVSNE